MMCCGHGHRRFLLLCGIVLVIFIIIYVVSKQFCVLNKQFFRNGKEMPQKYFENPYEDYSPDAAKNVSAQSILTLGLNEKWDSTIHKMQYIDYNDNSVYTGTSGIALLHLKRNPGNIGSLQEIKSLLSLHKLRNKRHTFLCGDAGPLAIGIVAFHKMGKAEEAEQLVAKLKSMDKDVLNIHSDLPNEYLYGRVGYLFAILFVNRNVVVPQFDDSFIRMIIEVILKNGQIMSKSGNFKCPLMYQWHGTYYLGAAHGITGILYLLLQVKGYLTQIELTTLIKPTIDYLITQRFPSGNYPSSLSRDSDKYVQWCHGAPGFLYLFTTAYKVFQQANYLQLALECGDVIWKRGLLKKGYSICHGVAGNAYCFLELYQTTKDEKHLYRAHKFAEWCYNYSKTYEEHEPDRPLSLYEGISGPMYLLLDIQNPMEAKFPGFTL